MDCFNHSCPFRVNETSNANRCECLACQHRGNSDFIITSNRTLTNDELAMLVALRNGDKKLWRWELVSGGGVMTEYIKREDAIDAVLDVYYNTPDIDLSGERLEAAILNIPAADVAPVRHGRWIQPHWKNSNYCCNCSECGREAMHRDYQWDKNGIYPLCPHCGAYMMGENNGKCE